MLSSNRAVAVQLDRPGYATVWVIDPSQTAYLQGEIANTNDGAVPASFGGIGDFVIAIRTSDRPIPHERTDGNDQLRAYIKVR